MTNQWMPIALIAWLGWSSWAGAADGPAAKPPAPLHVDTPVKLDKADVVCVMDHPVFTGDMPMGLKYVQLVVQRFKETGTPGRIIALFYYEAGYMVLNDRAYNAARKVNTGAIGRLIELVQQGYVQLHP